MPSELDKLTEIGWDDFSEKQKVFLFQLSAEATKEEPVETWAERRNRRGSGQGDGSSN